MGGIREEDSPVLLYALIALCVILGIITLVLPNLDWSVAKAAIDSALAAN